MKQIQPERKKPDFVKPIVLLLAFASVAFALLGLLNALVEVEKDYGSYSVSVQTVQLSDIIRFFSLRLPCILLIVYALKRSCRTKIPYIPIILGWIGIRSLLSILRMIPVMQAGLYAFNADLLIDALIFITFTLAAIQALRGLKKKSFVIIAIVTALLIMLVSELYFICYVVMSKAFWGIQLLQWIIDWLCGLMEETTFYVALLLFCVKKRIPALLPVHSDKVRKKQN